MGLTNWRGDKIRKTDVSIAKNYLNKEEKIKPYASQPLTLPSRSKSQAHDQNLSKSVSVRTHEALQY